MTVSDKPTAEITIDGKPESQAEIKSESQLESLTENDSEKEAAMPVIIALLGYGGAIPFVALAAAHSLALYFPLVSPAALLIGYGAVILSFVGALGWGSHLRDEQIEPSKYIWSIVPALIGWFALMAPLQMAASMIIIGLLTCWWVDRAHIKKGVWPKWMGRLRTHLTVLACLSLSALLVF